MPQNKIPKRPPVMTWPKATFVLASAAIFYALRFIFEQFWFFAPAFAAVYCKMKVGGALAWLPWELGAKTAATVCGSSAIVVGYFGAPAIAAFGAVMAMAVGFMGWLAVYLIIFKTNRRIFKEQPMAILWLIGGLGVSEVPFIDMFPGLLGAVIKLYHTQIKEDKKKLKAYEEELATFQEQERAQKVISIQAFKQRRAAEAEAEASREIPVEQRKAA